MTISLQNELPFGCSIAFREILFAEALAIRHPHPDELLIRNARILRQQDLLLIGHLLQVETYFLYALALHGDFDISSFVFKRGTRREDKQSFQAFKEDLEQKRQEAFNYPLFLGIVYLIVAALIAYLIL